jgi:hypothetical protein
VEFEESSDERSGKPLAIRVVRVDAPVRVRVDSGSGLHDTQTVRIPGIIVKEAKV